MPLTLFMHLAGYRVVKMFTERIGHLAVEPDCLLKEVRLGQLADRKWVLLVPDKRIANQHLLAYWAPYFRLVRSPILAFILGSMSRWWLLRHDMKYCIRAIGQAQRIYQVYADWAERPPLLSLTQDDQQWGEAMLRKLGIPPGAWFVCIHAREGGFSPIDEELHSYRNSDIAALIPAVLDIVRRGGWVVRLGDQSMAPLPALPQTIDYAHHALRSARMDVVLCAKARFILASTSGIALVGTIFGVPCALVNMVPITALGLGSRDLSIPKLHWSLPLGRYLTFAEVFSSVVACGQYSALYQQADIRLEDNSPEDIEELVDEMFAELSGHPQTNPQQLALQQRFQNLMLPKHYSFGGAAKTGAHFLQRHKELLHL